jgi:DNA-binding LacI/PurR family transcriptional regulator
VSQSTSIAGEMLVENLLDQLNGKQPEKLQLKPALIIRQST